MTYRIFSKVGTSEAQENGNEDELSISINNNWENRNEITQPAYLEWIKKTPEQNPLSRAWKFWRGGGEGKKLWLK